MDFRHSLRHRWAVLNSTAVKTFVFSGFSLNFQVFSFIPHLLTEVFPFVFPHPLEHVDPCFEDSSEGFFSGFLENVGDHVL
jgi:hypothetical protein